MSRPPPASLMVRWWVPLLLAVVSLCVVRIDALSAGPYHGDLLVVLSIDGNLTGYNPEGARLWTFNAGPLTHTPAFKDTDTWTMPSLLIPGIMTGELINITKGEDPQLLHQSIADFNPAVLETRNMTTTSVKSSVLVHIEAATGSYRVVSMDVPYSTKTEDVEHVLHEIDKAGLPSIHTFVLRRNEYIIRFIENPELGGTELWHTQFIEYDARPAWRDMTDDEETTLSSSLRRLRHEHQVSTKPIAPIHTVFFVTSSGVVFKIPANVLTSHMKASSSSAIMPADPVPLSVGSSVLIVNDTTGFYFLPATLPLAVDMQTNAPSTAVIVGGGPAVVTAPTRFDHNGAIAPVSQFNNSNRSPWRPNATEAKPADTVSVVIVTVFVTAATAALAFYALGKRGSAKPVNDHVADVFTSSATSTPNTSEHGTKFSNSGDSADVSEVALNSVDESSSSSSSSASASSLLGSSADIGREEESAHNNQHLVVYESNHPQSRTLTILRDRPLGTGSAGTVVYQGRHEMRDVAVKCMVREAMDIAQNEAALLQQVDDHPNVIRYFLMTTTPTKLYLALELCHTSLYDLVVDQAFRDPKSAPLRWDGRLLHVDQKTMTSRDILRAVLAGLHHIHQRNIIHRDVKPQNILLTADGRVLLSDFGLCRRVEVGQDVHQTRANIGSSGWMAPEMIRAEDPHTVEITRAVDAFGVGCVVHFVVSDGAHPFGDDVNMWRYNIVTGKTMMSDAVDDVARDLVRGFVSADPLERVHVTDARAHPFFWSEGERLDMLCEAGDMLNSKEAGEEMKPLMEAVEEGAENVIGQEGWNARIDEELVADLRNRRGYNFLLLRHLLRAIRNKHHHQEELKGRVRQLLLPAPHQMLKYFEDAFPGIFMHVYSALREHADIALVRRALRLH